MGFAKPTVQLNWILDDDPTKMTVPDAAAQLLGHVNATNADNKIFNWCWNRVSKWLEFLDNTYDTNGNQLFAPRSTTITEIVAPTASTITLDAGGIKSWDGSSNAIFSVTEGGVATLGYSGNDIISLSGGAISVGTATSADLVKLHALTPSALDLNIMLGASGNGLVVADITKLADISASAAEVNILTGATLSTAELNILDGVTVTYDKINYLGATGLTAADLTKLAGIDATAANINRLDSIHGMSITTGNTTGSALYVNDTAATKTAILIDDSGGTGIEVVQTANNYNAFNILDCGGHGLYIESVYNTSTDAVHVDTSGVADYCRSYLYGAGCDGNGVYIATSGMDGVRVVAPGQHGLHVLTSGSASYDSIYVANSLRHGLNVNNAAEYGIVAGNCDAGAHGPFRIIKSSGAVGTIYTNAEEGTIALDSGGKFHCYVGSAWNQFLTVSTTSVLSQTIFVDEGYDIKINGDDTTPATLALNGTTYDTEFWCNNIGSTAFIAPTATDQVDFCIGAASYRFNDIYANAVENITLEAIDGTKSAELDINGNVGKMSLILGDGSDAGQYDWYPLKFWPLVPDVIDLGGVNHEWKNLFVLNTPTVGDFPYFDYRLENGKIIEVNDLEIIEAIKPSGDFDPITGMELIDDNTIPEWLKFKNNKTGKPEYNKNGKPYLDLKTMISLNMGCIRQLNKEQKENFNIISKIIEQLANRIEVLELN